MTEPTPRPCPAPLPEQLARSAAERLEAIRASAGAAGVALAEPLPGDAERVLACSAFVATWCARRPAILADLLASGDLARAYDSAPADDAPRTGTLRDHVEAAIADAGGVDDLMARLRTLRLREMIRIAWRDIGGLAALEEIVADTTALADAAVDAALAWLHPRFVERHGEPTGPSGRAQRLVVIGLGKLGAGELNFSSDIDLLFVYPESGETVGGGREIDNEKFFLRLGRELIRVLEEATPDGYVFRVDMRLRPFGAAGPLALSLNALEEYYQSHGRDWERYALIRARVVAGDREAGHGLLARLRPFVYRRYIDFGTLESLREMKALIEREVTRRGLEGNVKLGAGGIREVEFTGQAFQLVRGGRTAALRDRRILAVLARLGERELLPRFAVAELAEAYRFLRDAEHRLQEADDRQTHVLPEDADARARLAAAMGYADWAAFARDLAHHRANVRAHFSQVFGVDEAPEAAAEGDPVKGLWEGALDEPEAVALLEREGFDDAAAAYDAIRRFREEHAVRLSDRTGRERLARLFPDLLRAVACQDDAGETLRRVLAFLESIVRRSVYVSLLAERPLALSQLVRLCAASPRIARLLARHPIVLDELLDPRSLYAPLERGELEHDVRARLGAVADGDAEQEMDVLREFKQANVLRVAAADVGRTIPLMRVSDFLTEIAETTLRAALDLAWRDLVARYGEPTHVVDGEVRTAPFAVVAYGKLGGLELGYGSDLDLVFVHGATGDDRVTAGERGTDDETFFARLAQRVIHVLGTMTTQGVLYEVDPRLRPDGAKGVLVNGVGALGAYLREKAWTWEHQALVRARPVAGDPELGRRFARLRREVILLERDPERLRADVREMRARMRRELGTGSRPGFDIKQDAGGVADIEFMVQYGALRWASRLGEYLEFTDNIRLLEGFGRAGLVPGADVAALTDAFRTFRVRMHQLALQEASTVVGDDEFAAERETVGRIWTRLMEE